LGALQAATRIMLPFKLMYRYNFPLFLAVFAMLSNVPAFGQKKDKPSIMTDNVEWSEGTVLTNDGTELKGLLRYEDNANILYFQDGNVSHAYTSRSVTGFEFTDAVTGKQRVFYTLPAIEMNTDIERPLFFEFLREFENFTVFSRMDPVSIDKKMRSPTANPMDPIFLSDRTSTGGYARVVVSQSETIYLMDKNGVIKPYLQITEREVPGALVDFSKVKNKVLDDELLESLTAPLYDRVKECADKNQLSLKRKNDLLAILDCYAKS